MKKKLQESTLVKPGDIIYMKDSDSWTLAGAIPGTTVGNIIGGDAYKVERNLTFFDFIGAVLGINRFK